MDKSNSTRRRGGSRQGAGRPKGTSRMYTFRADKEVAEFIDMQANKTEFIRQCIAAAMPAGNTSAGTLHMAGLGEAVAATKVAPMALPFFDINIVAGFPVPLNNDELAQDIELLHMLCPHRDSTYLIRVVGDSMTGAGISSGDILIVDKSMREPTEKQIAVCELNGEYTVKHVAGGDNGVRLVPAQPDYPVITVSDDDNFRVWGTVTFIIHKPQ